MWFTSICGLKYAATLSIGLPRARGLNGVSAWSSRKTTTIVGVDESTRIVGDSAVSASRNRSISVATRRMSLSAALPTTIRLAVRRRFQSRLSGPAARAGAGPAAGACDARVAAPPAVAATNAAARTLRRAAAEKDVIGFVLADRTGHALD